MAANQVIDALGAMHSASWESDPKHLGFVLRRYHFVARMLQGCNRVLEIGCGEGTGAKLVQQAVKELHGIDCDGELLPNAPNMHRHNILDGSFRPVGHYFWDAIYALDVLEHIPPKDQDIFFRHILNTLSEHGVMIIGTPSLESQRYASELSKKHHVNARTEISLRAVLGTYFHNVFLFGLNDYALHDGFGPMCHYRLAICTGRK